MCAAAVLNWECAWQVRHQFLVAGKRFLTVRQFCKLMMKRYRLAKIEVQSSRLLAALNKGYAAGGGDARRQLVEICQAATR